MNAGISVSPRQWCRPNQGHEKSRRLCLDLAAFLNSAFAQLNTELDAAARLDTAIGWSKSKQGQYQPMNVGQV